jgi:hypothetical protein
MLRCFPDRAVSVAGSTEAGTALVAYELFPVSLRTGGQGPAHWYRTDGPSGVRPWPREGSGFTLMMEALMMLLSAKMPVDAMADLLDEHNSFACRYLRHIPTTHPEKNGPK